MLYDQKEEYIATIRRLKKEYESKIDLKVGYEVEYMDTHEQFLMDMRKECDYMILGQHCAYFGYEYDCYCNDESIKIYVSQIEKALSKGLITYVAHPDYFMLGRRTFNSVCVDAAHRITKASLMTHTPLEINLNGFHYGKKSYQILNSDELAERYPYPFREFWEIISNYGCQIVYGYDAHTPIAFLEQDRMAKANEILNGLPLKLIDTIRLK